MTASRNDVTDGMKVKEGLFSVILEACKVAMYFRRTASRFGQHSSKFFERGGSILLLFFSMDSDSTHRDLSKNDFFEILSIFLGLRQNFGLFF